MLLEFALVRPNFIILFAIALYTGLASGETIRLKNGCSIVADRVSENKEHIEYEIGDNTFAISKSAVDHIEHIDTTTPGSAGISSGSSLASADLPAFTPSDSLIADEQLSLKIIRDGRVDADALAAMERSGSAELAAAACFIAGRHDQERGDRDKARLYFQRALNFMPENAVLLEHYAAALIQMQRASEAVPFGEHATRLAPASPDAFSVLGFAYFGSDRNKNAITAWKRSLELRPDAAIQKYLERAQREVLAESDFSQRENGHFILRYEGGRTPEALGNAVLSALAGHYDDLVRELGVSPHNNIPVILYTDQAYFDVTQAPAWTGAMNDGKLRIPIEGVRTMTPELSRVLKHELAHSFINQISNGRCPQWLHEGIAQALEPKSISSNGRRLAQLFGGHHQIPLNVLESSFMQLSAPEARIAYAEALAAVEYVRDTYGMSELRRVLEKIGEGASTEAALRTTVHSGYAQLEEDIGSSLKRKYGE